MPTRSSRRILPGEQCRPLILTVTAVLLGAFCSIFRDLMGSGNSCGQPGTTSQFATVNGYRVTIDDSNDSTFAKRVTVSNDSCLAVNRGRHLSIANSWQLNDGSAVISQAEQNKRSLAE